MTTHYKIELLKTKATLKLSYRNGKFLRIELLKGKLSSGQYRHIGVLIPPLESELEAWQKKLKETAIFEPFKKKESQFTKFTAAWFSFYEDFVGFPPKFGAADGMHLKKIMKHLETIGGSPDEALSLWNTILAAWPKLSDFHKDNTDLKYINSRLNVLLNAVKKAINGKTSVTGTDSSASL